MWFISSKGQVQSKMLKALRCILLSNEKVMYLVKIKYTILLVIKRLSE